MIRFSLFPDDPRLDDGDLVFLYPSGDFTEKRITMKNIYVDWSGSLMRSFSLFEFTGEQSSFNLTRLSNLIYVLPMCSPTSEPRGDFVIDRNMHRSNF